jgi:predicted metal-dependent hydrolase
MGSYHHETRVIRLHPALDRPEVPAYFVRYVVFHEMVHQAVPIRRTGAGRREVHGREFRRRERTCPDYDRALARERDHLPLLLGRRRARIAFDPDDPLA